MIQQCLHLFNNWTLHHTRDEYIPSFFIGTPKDPKLTIDTIAANHPILSPEKRLSIVAPIIFQEVNWNFWFWDYER